MPESHNDITFKLRQLRSEGEDWLLKRDKMIRHARESGMTLRDIGNAVGLSYAGVDKIVKGNRVQDNA